MKNEWFAWVINVDGDTAFILDKSSKMFNLENKTISCSLKYDCIYSSVEKLINFINERESGESMEIVFEKIGPLGASFERYSPTNLKVTKLDAAKTFEELETYKTSVDFKFDDLKIEILTGK